MASFRYLLSLVLICIYIVPCCAQQQVFVIAKKSNARIAIVTAEDATVTKIIAAHQLLEYLKRITGGDFPISQTGHNHPVRPESSFDSQKKPEYHLVLLNGNNSNTTVKRF
jgi:hypothetical protein